MCVLCVCIQVVVFVIWSFISFPLATLGTIVGRNCSCTPDNPCRVKTIPRPIPQKKWYLTPWVVSVMGGLLPFGSIFIEMYFIFTSFWNYKVSDDRSNSIRILDHSVVTESSSVLLTLDLKWHNLSHHSFGNTSCLLGWAESVRSL